MNGSSEVSEIENDRLGRIGEDHFRLLCNLADLVPQKCNIDITGWDFVVEQLPASGAGQLPLEQRRVQAAHVQLKTTRGRCNNRVRLSLSSAQRFALDPRPALLIVLRTRPDGQLRDGYLVHFIGTPLERLLYRLRLAGARQEHDINQKDLSFDYVADGVRFEPTAAGLRAALEACWGPDLAAYIAHKEWELENLGYDEFRFEVKALVHIRDPQHMNDVLLGLAPLRPETMQTFEKRFGIALPCLSDLFDEVEEFRVMPPSLGPCVVHMRTTGLVPAAAFSAEMFIGPPIEELDGGELLIRHEDFIIRFRVTEMKFESTGHIDTDERTAADWRMYVRALCYLGAPGASIVISGNERMPTIPLELPSPINGPFQEDLPRLLVFLDNWMRLLETAGVSSTSLLTWSDLWSAHDAWLATELCFNPQTSAYMEYRSGADEEVQLSHGFESLYFNAAALGDAHINYALKAVFERTGDPEWPLKTTTFTALNVGPALTTLDAYGAEQLRLHDLAICLDPATMIRTDPSTLLLRETAS